MKILSVLLFCVGIGGCAPKLNYKECPSYAKTNELRGKFWTNDDGINQEHCINLNSSNEETLESHIDHDHITGNQKLCIWTNKSNADWLCKYTPKAVYDT